MAQEPKKKHSKAYKRTRRASIFLKPAGLSKCPNCNADRLPHMACPECGSYRGKTLKTQDSVTVTKA